MLLNFKTYFKTIVQECDIVPQSWKVKYIPTL